MDAVTCLRVDGVTKSFGGVTAVDDVTFGIDGGVVHAIIGPNGAGKTTLINLLSGVYRPTRGRIVFDSRELTHAPAHAFGAAGIARTFQTPQVFGNMSVVEKVMTGRHRLLRQALWPTLVHARSLARAERDSRAHAQALLRLLGLADQAEASPAALSFGAQKRLEIARALASEPALLLLDEPAAGLNATEAREIGRVIRHLAERGVGVVLVEHDMRLVMGVSDRILVLQDGRCLCEGSADDVRNDARVIDAYLGAGDGHA
jgi:branched-chain amino acid transport system ATP-binding protein